MASILIVDDDAPIRTVLRDILEEDGHEIREAADGQTGLTLYRETPADLVITDILMPERDGMGVTLASDTGISGCQSHCHDRGGGRTEFSEHSQAFRCTACDSETVYSGIIFVGSYVSRSIIS